jgi:hypothetical protein
METPVKASAKRERSQATKTPAHATRMANFAEPAANLAAMMPLVVVPPPNCGPFRRDDRRLARPFQEVKRIAGGLQVNCKVSHEGFSVNLVSLCSHLPIMIRNAEVIPDKQFQNRGLAPGG